jgi:hypothetical protein
MSTKQQPNEFLDSSSGENLDGNDQRSAAGSAGSALTSDAPDPQACLAYAFTARKGTAARTAGGPAFAPTSRCEACAGTAVAAFVLTTSYAACAATAVGRNSACHAAMSALGAAVPCPGLSRI